MDSYSFAGALAGHILMTTVGIVNSREKKFKIKHLPGLLAGVAAGTFTPDIMQNLGNVSMPSTGNEWASFGMGFVGGLGIKATWDIGRKGIEGAAKDS